MRDKLIKNYNCLINLKSNNFKIYVFDENGYYKKFVLINYLFLEGCNNYILQTPGVTTLILAIW